MTQSTGRLVVIGDVHGHYETLMRLLALVDSREGDRICFLGDLVDRGPRSCDVVEFVRAGGYPCVLGNHEQMMLAAFPKGRVAPAAMMAWLYSGGRETLSSYSEGDREPLLHKHIAWMRQLPLYLDLGEVWLVHAGVDPLRSLGEQTENDFCWIREPFHRISEPYFADKTIVTGHTITFTLPGLDAGQIARGPGWLGIDTGAYARQSGWLTALDTTHWEVYQVNVFDSAEVRVLPLERIAKGVAMERLKVSR